MKGPTRSPAIRRAVERARKLGYTVEFKDFCEDAETPGMLGQFAGVCVASRKAIKVRTNGMSRAHIAAIIEHELEHAEGKERGTDRPELGLRCGGTVNVFGEPGSWHSFAEEA